MNDETSKLIAKVERFARQEQLFAPAEPGRALHLCAAVSGGADSMALLQVLLELREAFGDACRMDTGASWIHQLLYLGLYLYPTRYRRLINDPQPTGRFFRKETINLLINLTH